MNNLQTRKQEIETAIAALEANIATLQAELVVIEEQIVAETAPETKLNTTVYVPFAGATEVSENTEFYVYSSGTGGRIRGENARLVKVLSKHLVFETVSGAIVKTESHLFTVGKAEKAGYAVALGSIEKCEADTWSIADVKYWCDKASGFVKK